MSESIRRIFDILVSAFGLALLSPLFLLVAVLIKLDSPGPVFYRAARIGKMGKPFLLYKFRSMVTDADKFGPGITVSGDKRVTPVGSFLRKTKIDELPQLINVFKGEMSFVGPRPEDQRYVALYTVEQQKILTITPGLTSPASLTFRHEEQILSGEDWQEKYIQEIMPQKISIDLEYFAKRNFFSDVLLIIKTIYAMFR